MLVSVAFIYLLLLTLFRLAKEDENCLIHAQYSFFFLDIVWISTNWLNWNYCTKGMKIKANRKVAKPASKRLKWVLFQRTSGDPIWKDVRCESSKSFKTNSAYVKCGNSLSRLLWPKPKPINDGIYRSDRDSRHFLKHLTNISAYLTWTLHSQAHWLECLRFQNTNIRTHFTELKKNSEHWTLSLKSPKKLTRQCLAIGFDFSN